MKKKFILSLLMSTSIIFSVSFQPSYAIDLKEELNNIQNENQEFQEKVKTKINKKTFFSILKKRYYSEKRASLKQKTILIENGPFLAFDQDGNLANTGSLGQDIKDTDELKKTKFEAWYVISMVLVNNYKLKLDEKNNNEEFLRKVFEIFRSFADSAVKYYIYIDNPLLKTTRDDYKKELLNNLEKINDLKTKYSSDTHYSALRDPLYNLALDFNSFLESIESDYINELNKSDERQDMRKMKNFKKTTS